MLDPFTALSLAGNVVQFVQFGCHLAAKAHEIHSSTSGASEDGLEMEAVTARLLETVQDLDDQQIGRDALKLRDRDSPKERRLMEIADACRMIAADILRRLEVLKQHKPPSVWNSISQAFKCIWTEDELMALTRRLKAYISELDTAILVSLKYATTHDTTNWDALAYYLQTQYRSCEHSSFRKLLQARRGITAHC